MYTASKEIVRVFTEGCETSQIDTIIEMIEKLSSEDRKELTRRLRKNNSFSRKAIFVDPTKTVH